MTRRVCLAKFGGGLITDKTRDESPRLEVIADLAAAFAGALESADCAWVLGHGSGSFGHRAARGSILDRPAASAGRVCADDQDRLAVARTADAAARLHAILREALLAASVPCFSWLPSSVLSGATQGGSIDGRGVRALLEEGLVPLTMGDVVVGGPDGTEIWSTERVLRLIVTELADTGWSVHRVLWFGNTDGILDRDETTIDRVDEGNLAEVRHLAGGSDGVDVTGGMRLRLDTCAELAEVGVESWILDGRDREVVRSAFAGVRVRGTQFRSAYRDRRIGDSDPSD